MDHAADEVIQRAIRTKLVDVTVLTMSVSFSLSSLALHPLTSSRLTQSPPAPHNVSTPPLNLSQVPGILS